MITRRTFVQGLVGSRAAPPPRTEARSRRRSCARSATPCAGRCWRPGTERLQQRAPGVQHGAATASGRPPSARARRHDVRAVVAVGGTFDVPLVARSGGHGYNGNSTSRRAVVVDLGAPERDPLRRRRSRRSGRRAQLGDVYAALAAHGVDDPRRLVPDRRGRRARARRRDGARRARDGADARPRAQLRRRHRRRATRRARRRRATCSGRCAAAAGASRSSPRAPAHPPRRHRRVLLASPTAASATEALARLGRVRARARRTR